MTAEGETTVMTGTVVAGADGIIGVVAGGECEEKYSDCLEYILQNIKLCIWKRLNNPQIIPGLVVKLHKFFVKVGSEKYIKIS